MPDHGADRDDKRDRQITIFLRPARRRPVRSVSKIPNSTTKRLKKDYPDCFTIAYSLWLVFFDKKKIAVAKMYR